MIYFKSCNQYRFFNYQFHFTIINFTLLYLLKTIINLIFITKFLLTCYFLISYLNYWYFCLCQNIFYQINKMNFLNFWIDFQSCFQEFIIQNYLLNQQYFLNCFIFYQYFEFLLILLSQLFSIIYLYFTAQYSCLINQVFFQFLHFAQFFNYLIFYR
ncbi:hypothetical protein IMG5_043400 [Ichthyophthirius multifiliis]|uniref:Transmembrane protein n=1 Tax=Ichthyophthirius multifiliis TaxID=5932 RepID=G0QM43_ICHMU|nr:hypothetical protein IMG5_043400 [Ichthyophthirius multifiliis]EGR33711.1 hypothetical protein IMG5_043400 [Ichthyophthirius multifiliis]|eukprot:XP_004037697.1 hypothetical protein IMG5_043400 [Ichthyophthirius multifiliis]